MGKKEFMHLYAIDFVMKLSIVSELLRHPVYPQYVIGNNRKSVIGKTYGPNGCNPYYEFTV